MAQDPELYEISEMAHMFGLSRQALIYYDRIGLLSPARVSPKGYRQYAPTQIPALRLLCILRDLGLGLKDIQKVLSDGDPDQVAKLLCDRLGDIDRQRAELDAKAAQVRERLGFYEEMGFWREREGQVVLRHYPERRVVGEPYPGGPMGRERLHPCLMRALSKLYEGAGCQPVCGWGTYILRDSLASPDPLAGAGSFVVVPDEVSEVELPDLRVLPEGVYLCFARWGMPYNLEGVRRMGQELRRRCLEPVADAFDFCLIDTTGYDSDHIEDFCCLQVPVQPAS